MLLLFLPTPCIANNAMIAWISEIEGGVTQVNVQKMISGDWQKPELIYSSKELNYSPAIGSNQQGDVIVVWTARSTVRSVARAIFFRNGKWQKNEIIANQGGLITTPAVVFDTHNDANVVWVSDHNGLDDVFYRKWVAEENQWTVPEAVHEANEVPDILPNIVLDRNADVLVKWQSITPESKNYSELSRIYKSTAVTTEVKNNLNNETRRELSYSDITLPKGWGGSIGVVVMHFPDNNLVRQQKLPRYLTEK